MRSVTVRPMPNTNNLPSTAARVVRPIAVGDRRRRENGAIETRVYTLGWLEIGRADLGFHSRSP